MAEEKTKRLRTHVVKELYDTEKDYTEHLEFTVEVSPAHHASLVGREDLRALTKSAQDVD